MAASKKSSGGNVQRLDTQYFSTAIYELDSAISTFNNALDRIKRQTNQLQSSWDGAGADKFDSAYKRLKQEFNDQSENLTALRDDLKTMLETYENWDAELKSSISGNTMGE